MLSVGRVFLLRANHAEYRRQPTRTSWHNAVGKQAVVFPQNNGVALASPSLERAAIEHLNVAAGVVDQSGALEPASNLRHALAANTQHAAKDFLRQNMDLANEIENLIRQKALSGEIALPLEIGVSDDDSGGSDEEA